MNEFEYELEKYKLEMELYKLEVREEIDRLYKKQDDDIATIFKLVERLSFMNVTKEE